MTYWDPELRTALDRSRGELPATITPDLIPLLQNASVQTDDAVTTLEQRFAVRLEQRAVGSSVDVVVARPSAVRSPAPVIFFVHGGGMVMGSPVHGLDLVLPWAVAAGAVVVSVGYRLAPQHPDPVPADDCRAALLWTVAHADGLGIDPGRIVLAGHSAGGGLAAGLALRMRDEGGLRLRGQLLMCPMLDDRESTPSSVELDGDGVWDRTSNTTGWTALLGDRRGGPDVGVHAAPARATDLSALPPTYIDVGSAETFRDEVVGFASRIWHGGGAAELHVWPGAYHCFEIVAPEAGVARAALAARRAWALRALGPLSR
ncbi:MAG: alpha/beta hydrolase [Pseudonocardia sp.]|uniref:alpha/beta hydrolase n=1 Tax=unclassified Pseudonocardia TaxID=2619320 RepID=UPI00086F7E1F|nr:MULTISPECIES: alpha/beta hydrolase [unclassified Pseudonocardia]MBN9112455.1 alpha/beta hydrolase [Pseudonocardia sp.]ODU27279.1 MAG: esterase [Pseudonocardia sp. SCN 72-51]ODV08892.1 MAG: esterase [Pseudonocardia sp. SCN 73-27]